MTPSSDQIKSESSAEKESVVKECGFFQKKDYDGDDEKFEVAIEMLGSMTMRGYTKLSKLIKKAYNIPKKWMPSFAKLTENRPKMVGFELEPRLDTLINCPPSVGISDKATKTEIVQSLADVGLEVDLGDINDTSWTHDPLVPKTQKLELSSFAGKDLSLEDV